MARWAKKRHAILNRPAILARQEKDMTALSLWLGGATLTHIAASVLGSGVKISSAKRAVDRARQRLIAEPVEQARKDDLERLRRLLLAVFSKALQGDLDAIDRVLAILARRAKLLGLDMQRDAEMVKDALALTQNNTQINVLIQVGDRPAIALEDWRRQAIESSTNGQGAP